MSAPPPLGGHLFMCACDPKWVKDPYQRGINIKGSLPSVAFPISIQYRGDNCRCIPLGVGLGV